MTRLSNISHKILPRVNLCDYYLIIANKCHIASVLADSVVNVDILCCLSSFLNVEAQNVSLKFNNRVIFLQLTCLTAMHHLLELFLNLMWLLVLR